MPSRTVLLIDDEIDLLEELHDGLSSRGLTVVTARAGKEGLVKAEQSYPDIIICDISMPGMDGYQVLENLRRMPLPLSTTPFIFLTAHSGVEDEIKGRGFGADDYIAKPVDLKRLHAIIGSRLIQAERFEEAAQTRIVAAQQRVIEASARRMDAMEQAFVELRPILREASGANMQLVSLMEGITEPEWTDLARSTNDRLRRAQNIVRSAGILAAVPPAPRQVSTQPTSLSDAASFVMISAASRMHRGGTQLVVDDGLVVADPDALRTIVAALVVWTSEQVPSAVITLSGDGDRLSLRLKSDHRQPFEIERAWQISIGGGTDPADDIARLLADTVEYHGGSIAMTARHDAAVLDVRLTDKRDVTAP